MKSCKALSKRPQHLRYAQRILEEYCYILFDSLTSKTAFLYLSLSFFFRYKDTTRFNRSTMRTFLFRSHRIYNYHLTYKKIKVIHSPWMSKRTSCFCAFDSRLCLCFHRNCIVIAYFFDFAKGTVNSNYDILSVSRTRLWYCVYFKGARR